MEIVNPFFTKNEKTEIFMQKKYQCIKNVHYGCKMAENWL